MDPDFDVPAHLAAMRAAHRRGPVAEAAVLVVVLGAAMTGVAVGLGMRALEAAYAAGRRALEAVPRG